MVPVLKFEALVHENLEQNMLGHTSALILNVDHQQVHAFVLGDVFARIFGREKLPVNLLVFLKKASADHSPKLLHLIFV